MNIHPDSDALPLTVRRMATPKMMNIAMTWLQMKALIKLGCLFCAPNKPKKDMTISRAEVRTPTVSAREYIMATSKLIAQGLKAARRWKIFQTISNAAKAIVPCRSVKTDMQHPFICGKHAPEAHPPLFVPFTQLRIQSNSPSRR